MQIGQRLGRLVLAMAALILAAGPGFGQSDDKGEDRRLVLLAAIEGPIGPATTRHVEKVIDEAEERQAEALVLRLYTPGGLADAMRDIIAEILDSRVPVIGYVAPPGAHAASAGTYILYATHVAAMAPATNLGAATPVQIGGMPGQPPPGGEDRGKGRDGGDGQGKGKDGGAGSGDGAADKTADEPAEEPASPLSGSDAMTAKATNDAVAFIRSLAEQHGRNADWAEKAVREAASLSATEALEENVINLVADDVDKLLESVDGRTVTIKGAERTLATSGAVVEEIQQDAITRLLGILSNPNVALVLMMIGIYGLIFEFMNPGAVAPGVIGAICLILALYSLNQLPLDYAGLGLVILGIIFMVAEAITPAFGVLGFGGIVSFIIGSAMLVDTESPAYQVSWWVIGTMTAVSGAMLILLLGYTLRAYRGVPVSGRSALIGSRAEVLDWSGGEGHVWAVSERWRATGADDLSAGETVRISHVDGLTLHVDRSGDGGDKDRS